MKQYLLAIILPLLLLCEIVSGQTNSDTSSSASSSAVSSSSSSSTSSSSSSISASKTTSANPIPTSTVVYCIDNDHTLPDLLPNMTLKADAVCNPGCSSIEICEARCLIGVGEELCYCAKCYENSLYRKQCEYLKSKFESYYDSDSQICVCDYADQVDSRPQCYTIVTWTGAYNQAVTYAVPVSFWALVGGAVYYFCKRRQVNREYRELRNETIPLTNQRR